MIDFLIPAAQAADAGAGQGPSPYIDFFIIGAFVVIFYLIVWRPQSKRAKEHRELVAGLAKGDEIITNGGLVGKITKVEDQFIVFEAADNIELRLQKGAVSQALPKGTIKNI